jgi:GxxExxY protein
MKPNPGPDVRVSRSIHIVEKELSYVIVGCFFTVYNELGHGYLESVYGTALEIELRKRGLLVERERPAVVMYKGVEVGHHRLDMLVEGRIVIEIKSTEKINDIAKRQLQNCLTVLNFELGLLLHFGPTAQSYRVLRKGRVVSSRRDSAPSTNSDAGLTFSRDSDAGLTRSRNSSSP